MTTDQPTIEIDGTTYVVEAKEPNHGFTHWHDEPHDDGTPGQPAHHHHDEKCSWRPAMLKPLQPADANDHAVRVAPLEDILHRRVKLRIGEVGVLAVLVRRALHGEYDTPWPPATLAAIDKKLSAHLRPDEV